MKNANGYGSCFKLSGNRRKPYVVRLTAGHNEKGHPIYKVIGYYRTRSEGLMALADYHKQPYNLDKVSISVLQIFDKALEAEKNMAPNTLKNYHYSRKYFECIGNMPYRSVNLTVMQGIVDEQEDKPTAAKQIKNTFRLMDKYALQNDVILKGYAEFIQLSSYESQTKREPFTREEIDLLWQHSNDTEAKIILFLVYTGLRRNEFAGAEKSSVVDNVFTGGSKTKAGKNRVIPLHHKIVPIFNELCELSKGETIFPSNYYGSSFFFNVQFQKYCREVLGRHHIPHECRHTFVTELNRQHADPICIDRLAGHASGKMGADVYTHKTIKELKATVELLFR